MEVRLFATLRQGRFKKRQMPFRQGCSIGDLLASLDIPEEQVGILLVNGRSSSAECKLNQHDVVSIFPLIAGG